MRRWRTRVHTVEGEFEFPYLAHAPMEPLSAVCQLSSDRCEIWAGCQFQTLDQMNAAAQVGMKPEQVLIHTLAAGGTFGRRANPESDYICRGGFDRQGDRRQVPGAPDLDARGRHHRRQLSPAQFPPHQRRPRARTARVA